MGDLVSWLIQQAGIQRNLISGLIPVLLMLFPFGVVVGNSQFNGTSIVWELADGSATPFSVGGCSATVQNSIVLHCPGKISDGALAIYQDCKRNQEFIFAITFFHFSVSSYLRCKWSVFSGRDFPDITGQNQEVHPDYRGDPRSFSPFLFLQVIKKLPDTVLPVTPVNCVCGCWF